MKKKNSKKSLATIYLEAVKKEDFCKAFALALYISMIPALMDAVEKMDASRTTKTILKKSLLVPMSGLKKKDLEKIISLLWKKEEKK